MAAASPSLLRPMLAAGSPSPRRPDLRSRFLSPTRFSSIHRSPLSLRSEPLSPTSTRRIRTMAAQSNFLKVIQTAWRIGRESVEAGTNLLPGSIPRPVARIGVAGAMAALALFLFNSVLSTAFFVLALMGLIYFLYIAFNTDEGPRGGGGRGPLSEDESLEEARELWTSTSSNLQHGENFGSESRTHLCLGLTGFRHNSEFRHVKNLRYN
ncbi:hypothetical protein KSP39_PZI000671 [Platanthera zijinensis]|uniref:Uncharacterized protein n=1 Tax=Platanthera zijinensis TaxID=2320716 RepID=A0AAP0GFL1_9ASPA